MLPLSKRTIFYLIIGGLFLLILVLIITAFITPYSTPEDKGIMPTPTSVTIRDGQSRNKTSPPLRYAQGSGDKIVAKTKNRQPLEASDAAIRKSITDKLRQNNTSRSGIVYLSNAVRIEYLASADVFHAEIRTTDISAAKQEAVGWFQAQGMSQSGICNLPLIFYLYAPVAQALRTQNIVFNPLPEGC